MALLVRRLRVFRPIPIFVSGRGAASAFCSSQMGALTMIKRTIESRRTGGRWTEVEDGILVANWFDPTIDLETIAGLLPEPRSTNAIRCRGYKIGLGQKARVNSRQDKARVFPSWPIDMPHFEDHPDALPNGSIANAFRTGAYYVSVGSDLGPSAGDSTLEGAAIFPRGRKI